MSKSELDGVIPLLMMVHPNPEKPLASVLNKIAHDFAPRNEDIAAACEVEFLAAAAKYIAANIVGHLDEHEGAEACAELKLNTVCEVFPQMVKESVNFLCKEGGRPSPFAQSSTNQKLVQEILESFKKDC